MKAFLREPVSLNELPKGVLATKLAEDKLKLAADGKGTAEAKTNPEGKIYFLEGKPELIGLFN